MRKFGVCLIISAIGFSLAIRAEDEAKLAIGLAETAADFASKGRNEEAKLYYYKALFHDANCGAAMYEVAKLLEGSGDSVNALNFYVRASQELNKIGDPPSKAKSKDCEKHILMLSPFTTQFNRMMEDYAQELGKIATKNPDSLTQEEAQTMVTTLNLPQLIAADKLPDSLKDLAKTKEKKAEQQPRHRFPMMGDTPPAPAVVMAPDVERALKAAGWTTITGTWKKKSEGVYEVTDGKLEAANLNGVMQVVVHKGGTGSVRAFVRASRNDFIGDPDIQVSSKFADRFPSGFGWIIKDGEAKQYAPVGGWTDMETNTASPELDKTVTLGPAPKYMFTATVQDNKLELSVNGAAPRKTTNKIIHEGPMSIVIQGTMVIETPQTKGF